MASLVTAGRVGRAHGLDGSFKVNQARRDFTPGLVVTVAGTQRRVERAAGTARHPLIRLEGIADRGAATALGGEALQVAEVEAPLEEGEFRVADLVGCRVEGLGSVQRVLPGSSCDVLELDDGVLIPLIADAVNAVDLERADHRGRPRLPGNRGLRVKIDVFTLFPAWFDWFTEQRHVRNAVERGHELATVDLRSTTPLRGGQVDDTPYGGGAGMVVRVDVVEAALRARWAADPVEERGSRRVVALAASGRRFDDALASELAATDEVALLCGRYEGFDERVHEHLATDVVSIGPYVLAGGELAAMVVCDAVLRKLPGALGHEDSAVEESFSPALEGAPEYPHYTRPAQWRGHGVPAVLSSGDHARVREWRLEESRRRADRA